MLEETVVIERLRIGEEEEEEEERKEDLSGLNELNVTWTHRNAQARDAQ